MRTSPLVSIITPFMNEERYIKETIESVINQTYTNWEYILVDDGSSDSSSLIVKEYVENSNGKIIYVEHKGHVNKGVCAARNVGIARATGTWIALLDADDLWKPDKLQQQINILAEHSEVSMLCEATHYLGKAHDPMLENRILPVGVPPNRIYYPPELSLKLYPLGRGAAPCVGSIIIKASAIRKLGGFEESFKGKYSFYEDQAFLIKVYLNEIVFVSSICNNYYRQHPDSALHSSIIMGNYVLGRTFFLQWFKEYLFKQPFRHPAVLRLRKRIFLSYQFPLLFKISSRVYNKYKISLTLLKAKLSSHESLH